MKKVLLTGATGLIGKEAIKSLEDLEFDVYAPTIEEMDLFNVDSVESYVGAMKPQYLLHFAWYTGAGYLESELNNKFVNSSLELFKIFKKHGGKRIVSAGTCFEYKFTDELLKETSPLEPKTLYAKSKVDLYKKATEFCEANNISFGWGRIFYVYGKNEAEHRLTGMLMKKLVNNEVVTLNYGQLKKDYIYTKDIANAFAKFLDTDVEGCVNICTGKEISLEEFAKEFAKQLGKEQFLEILHKDTDQPMKIVGDNTKLITKVGYKPQYILENAVKEIKMKAKEGQRYIKEGRTKLETVIPLATPFILYLDPSSACNLQCEFCPCGRAHEDLWTDEKRSSIGIMDFDTYKKIIDDCQEFPDKIKTLRLYKEGEPLVNPNFAKMIKYAKDSGKFISIDTTSNGTLLNPELNREIIAAGLDRINISVEAMDADGYEKISNKRIDFDKFVENLRDLYEHRGNCHIFIKTMAENYDTPIEETRKRFYEIFGDICDEIAVENMAPCWPEFNKELMSENVGVYGNKIQKCVVCPRIFYILTINSDGEASRCIVDWNRKMTLGNVKDYSVKELWQKMDDYRLEHLKGNRRKMVGCAGCLEIETACVDNIDDYREELLEKFLNSKK